jgi:hypothetical protein
VRENRTSRSVKAALCLCMGLIAFGCLGPSLAAGSEAHVFGSSFGPDCTETTEFATAGSVGIDQGTHDVYVAAQGSGSVVRCNADGTPAEFTAGPGSGTNEIPGFSFAPEEALNQIAVNSTSHDFYVADFGANSIKAFAQDGEAAEFSATSSNQLTGFGGVCGVAVDANGDIYAGDISGSVDVFAPSGAAITSFSTAEPCNLAVDSAGTLYVAPYSGGGQPVGKFVPSSFPVTSVTTYENVGAVNSIRAFGLAVDPATDDVYIDERNRIVQFDADGVQIGSFAESGAGALGYSEGIAVDGSSGNVYASDVEGRRQVEIFTPPPPNPPSVGLPSATNITSTSADLHAQVNPELFKTTYRFEYLTQAEYQGNGETFAGAQATADTNLPGLGTPQSANAHISGLSPDTVYVFRIAAENENNEGTPAFSVGRFSTFPVIAPGLPDGRAYELVSPARKSGEVIPPEPFSDLGGTCTECLPGINTATMPMQSTPDGGAVLYEGQPFSSGFAAGPNQYLSGRGAAGWGTQSLSSSITTGSYLSFSSDLSRGVLFQEQPALTSDAPTKGGRSYPNLYLRDSDGSIVPLVTDAPKHREPFQFRIVFSAANSGTVSEQAFSHLVFEAGDSLTEEVPGIAPKAPEIAPGNEAFKPCRNGGTGSAEECNLYEWSAGGLSLVNVLPENTTAASGSFIGAGSLLNNITIGEPAVTDRAISADGSRIFWSTEETGQVYVRIDGERTLEIPGPGLCKESLSLSERVCFLTASTDGSEVLLSNGEIYRYDAGADEYQPLIDLTQGEGGFQGILGAGDDLSRVYFVDTQALAGENAEHKVPNEHEPGEDNLYAYQPDPDNPGQAETVFIGTLLPTDNLAAGVSSIYGTWKPSPADRLAQVSPDGRFLAFTSGASLTGYDNVPSGGGECLAGRPSCYEVFIYEGGSDQLRCASCNPTGQRPLGFSILSLIRPDGVSFRQPANLSPDGNGRLFFESQDRLSPRDTNGRITDVYEWEPNGVGSCQRSSGCVSLISSGHSANDSIFVDSTPSGNDAFFITREQLLPPDQNEQLDLYDARVGGGFEEALPPSCGGEGCRGSISNPPPVPGAGSANFSGPGNAPVKHKKKHHKKKHHKKHQKKKHHKRAKQNGGGSK